MQRYRNINLIAPRMRVCSALVMAFLAVGCLPAKSAMAAELEASAAPGVGMPATSSHQVPDTDGNTHGTDGSATITSMAGLQADVQLRSGGGGGAALGSAGAAEALSRAGRLKRRAAENHEYLLPYLPRGGSGDAAPAMEPQGSRLRQLLEAIASDPAFVEIHFDPRTGHPYYLNALTGEVSWENPFGLEEAELAAADELGEPAAAPDIDTVDDVADQRSQHLEHIWKMYDSGFEFSGVLDVLPSIQRRRKLPRVGRNEAAIEQLESMAGVPLDTSQARLEMAIYMEEQRTPPPVPATPLDLPAAMQAAEAAAASAAVQQAAEDAAAAASPTEPLSSSSTGGEVPSKLGGAAPTSPDPELAELQARRRTALSSAWNDLGNMWFARGEMGIAVDCFRKSLFWEPWRSSTLANIFGLLDGSGETRDADIIASYRRAMAGEEAGINHGLHQPGAPEALIAALIEYHDMEASVARRQARASSTRSRISGHLPVGSPTLVGGITRGDAVQIAFVGASGLFLVYWLRIHRRQAPQTVAKAVAAAARSPARTPPKHRKGKRLARRSPTVGSPASVGQSPVKRGSPLAPGRGVATPTHVGGAAKSSQSPLKPVAELKGSEAGSAGGGPGTPAPGSAGETKKHK